jgi:hypothetical protein
MVSRSSSRLSAISSHIDNKPPSNNPKMPPSIQIPDQLPWNPNNTQFPSIKDLPKLAGAPEGAAWVWGENDEVGYCYYSHLLSVSLQLIEY